MDARLFRPALVAATLLVSMGASYRTQNFVVHTADARQAAAFGQAAEQYRKDLAVSWLGEALPNWSQPCPITVTVGPQLGAGGATTFVFQNGEVFGWRMTIQGSYERVLDSVLPHEITHMIFATHFRRPLPRWADEGGATTVEHSSEKAKHKQMLLQFLRSNRGIAFNQMFAMTEYPADIMPLYAQGYSLAELLIARGGRRKYVDFLADGMDDNRWSAALKKHYGIEDLGTLQNTWLAWVRDGFPAALPAPPQPETSPATHLASATAAPKPARPEPNLIHRVRGDEAAGRDSKAVPAVHEQPAAAGATAAAQVPAAVPYRPGSTASPGVTWGGPLAPIPPADAPVAVAAAPAAARTRVVGPDGWYTAGTAPEAGLAVAGAHPGAGPEAPIHSQVTRPQPPEKSREIILEFQRTVRR